MRGGSKKTSGCGYMKFDISIFAPLSISSTFFMTPKACGGGKSYLP